MESADRRPAVERFARCESLHSPHSGSNPSPVLAAVQQPTAGYKDSAASLDSLAASTLERTYSDTHCFLAERTNYAEAPGHPVETLATEPPPRSTEIQSVPEPPCS